MTADACVIPEPTDLDVVPANGGALTFRLRRRLTNGIAMGGGFEIALACDIIIAAERAVFALPEPRVGLAALAGGLHRLPREIGTKRAMGMILTGRRASKDAVYRGLAEVSVQAALANQNSYPAVAAMYRSEDLREGPKAFAEKRAPQWKGK